MKSMNVLKNRQSNEKKSMTITVIVHAVLLIIGLLPLTSSIVFEQEGETQYVIPIEFAEFAQSSDEGLQAKSPVPDPEHKPVVEQEEVEPDIVEAEVIEEVAQVTEEVEPIESEIVEEVVDEVAASEDTQVNNDEASASEGGTNATLADGPTEGSDTAGDSDGQSGLDGDGVITRKIIYRQDISQVAFENGVIVVDICIDRQGKVMTAANNSENTTVEDMEMIRQALYLTTGYRFETDYSAAKRECGSLTFIFDIEGDMEVAEYAMNE